MNNSSSTKTKQNIPSWEHLVKRDTEWLLFKLKLIYGGKFYEGENPHEANGIREIWQEIVSDLGRELLLEIVKYFLSGEESVPNFAPSPAVFMKIVRAEFCYSYSNRISYAQAAIAAANKQKKLVVIKEETVARVKPPAYFHPHNKAMMNYLKQKSSLIDIKDEKQRIIKHIELLQPLLAVAKKYQQQDLCDSYQQSIDELKQELANLQQKENLIAEYKEKMYAN